MLVRNYMSTYPKTLGPDNTLKDAARLFFKYRLSGAPVITPAQEICGLITHRHLIGAITEDLPFSLPVSQVMTKNVITVTLDTPLEEARQIPVSHLPVVSDDRKLAGMLTPQDFLTAFYAQLHRANDEIQALVRSAHNGIVVINAFGIITTFNAAAAVLTGVPESAAIGAYIADVIPHTGLTRVLSTGKSETSQPITINGQALVSNRSPICEGSKIVGALAIIQDTSELVQAARQLNDTLQHAEVLENIFESLRQGIVVVDQNGVIIKVNRSYEEIFGIAREDLLNRPAQETIENTRLHVTAQTGVIELGNIQNYQGRQIIVNRVPLFNNGELSGAFGEILFKDISEISRLLDRLHRLERQVDSYKQQLKEVRVAEHTFDDIAGRSRVMVQVKNLAAKAALTDSNVLITGESGTGKELFAHAIHNASRRQGMPFVAINCAAIPAELLETELFGYDEGAFSGAKRGGKKGKFELADNGTIFLDEIGDMPLAMQAKLLRVLEERSFDRVGGTKTQPVDIRIMAATNKPLPQMIQEQTFRKDLYYRLNVISLALPPLREHREDLGELAEGLMAALCKKTGLPPKRLTPETMALFREYHWPGNVRELANLLEQLLVTIRGPLITPRHLPHLNWLSPRRRLAGMELIRKQAVCQVKPSRSGLPKP
ncbi:sigma 54-interacting transcriptional regulator [Acetonema longum]|uniref:Sigma54 specific transcriptional regulator n=1 Tax=Acetonema longum DSM 6540 TaxID=1009370 RepID=F7NDR4_9FIRM|nr:sigma 54-interacting transcriptional regulator [Acetonema longum]EGO65833.1 sigma54 specific transcriptional regulator [Acetonema longum DSM 6540]